MEIITESMIQTSPLSQIRNLNLLDNTEGNSVIVQLNQFSLVLIQFSSICVSVAKFIDKETTSKPALQ